MIDGYPAWVVAFQTFNPALEAIVFRPYVHIRDAGIAEDLLARLNDVRAAHHMPGVVANPVVSTVASDDCWFEVGEPGRQDFALVALAGRGVEKDRPRFRVGMQAGEWAIRQDQFLCPGGNELKTMAAWVGQPLGYPNQSRLAIRVQATVADPFTVVGRDP
ncbi:hypothetical protein D3C84_680430 [compost metagenome]